VLERVVLAGPVAQNEGHARVALRSLVVAASPTSWREDTSLAATTIGMRRLYPPLPLPPELGVGFDSARYEREGS
jgi:hypothetical protein